MGAAEIVLYLIAGHFLCDYALQGDWMSKAKNQTLSLIPGERIWPLALVGHASIHAAMVLLITQSVTLSLIELVLHTAIDYAKCAGRFGYNADQYGHLAMKFAFATYILVRP
jgi:hypothetical protein